MTVNVSESREARHVIEALNSLSPPALHPPPATFPSDESHDILEFGYAAGERRTIKVLRGGISRFVSVEGSSISRAPIVPLFAVTDLILPPEWREDLGNPTVYPPSEHPEYISEVEAIARVIPDATDPAHARAFARLMDRDDVTKYDPGFGGNAAPFPNRKVWFVSIHTETETRGTLSTPPSTVHGLSAIIDAETGMITDVGWGTAPIGSEHCTVCREQSTGGTGD